MQKKEYENFIAELDHCYKALCDKNENHPSITSLNACINQFKPYWIKNYDIPPPDMIKNDIQKSLDPIILKANEVYELLLKSKKPIVNFDSQDIGSLFHIEINLTERKPWQLIVGLRNGIVVEWVKTGSYKTVTLALTFVNSKWRPSVEGMVTGTSKIQATLRECNLMAKIQSPYIMHLLPGASHEKDSRSFHAPWVEQGDVETFLKSSTAQQGLSMLNVLLIFRTAFLGLQAIQKAKIIHQDIKRANLFIGYDIFGRFYIKIGDFSLAILESKSKGCIAKTSPGCQSPELLLYLINSAQSLEEQKLLKECSAYHVIEHFGRQLIPHSAPDTANDTWALSLVLSSFLDKSIHTTPSHQIIFNSLEELIIKIQYSTRKTRKDSQFYLEQLATICAGMEEREKRLFNQSLASHTDDYCYEEKLTQYHVGFFRSSKPGNSKIKEYKKQGDRPIHTEGISPKQFMTIHAISSQLNPIDSPVNDTPVRIHIQNSISPVHIQLAPPPIEVREASYQNCCRCSLL